MFISERFRNANDFYDFFQYPNGAASEEDRALTEYCKSDTSQLHQIALPD